MARVLLVSILLFAIVCLAMTSESSADGSHHKVILHVPFKVHTIHHHSIKKIPVYHYIEHQDHHHHHHHHDKHHHRHVEVEESDGDWD